MNNYAIMENFLNEVKRQMTEERKTMDFHALHQLLILYNIPQEKDREFPPENNSIFFNYFNENINSGKILIFPISHGEFLCFKHGEINKNAVKLYLPFDKEHIVGAAKEIFDFMISKGINHNSKIASNYRNDDFVIRVDSLEEANQIIDFINSKPDLASNLLRVNPFTPNKNGVGIVLDNSYSYNGVLCELIAELCKKLTDENRIDELNVETLHKFIEEKIKKLEKNKDSEDYETLMTIYSILAKTTKKGFKIEEFYEFAKEVLESKKPKIETSSKNNDDALSYLEQAVIITEKYHPGYAIGAISSYIKYQNARGFTSKENARQNLIDNVNPEDIMQLITEYLNLNAMSYSSNDEAIEKFVNTVLTKNRNKQQSQQQSQQQNKQQGQQQNQQQKPQKAQPGEKNSVIGTQDFKDSPLFEKLRHGFEAIGEAFSAPDARRKIIHTALTVAGGIGYVAVMANLNLLVPGLAVPGILMVANWIRNRLQLKKDLKAEKDKKDEKENSSPSDTPNDQQQNPNDIDLEAELRDINETYKNIATIESKLKALQKQLDELNPQTANYDAKKAELENMIQQANDCLEQTLENLRQAIGRVLAAYQIENVGGFKL